MTDLKIVADTFLHFIADNLASVLAPTPPVRNLRIDPSDSSADILQTNAVNIQFLNFSLGDGSAPSSRQAVIDILNDDDNAAVDWVSAVWKLLGAAFFTPALDYTDPTAPAKAGFNLSWESKRVVFRKVASDNYSHYSCTLNLQFRAI